MLNNSNLRVPINAPSRRYLDGNLGPGVLSILKNGPYLNGPFVEIFERDFANYIGINECVAVSSGMSALELAISSLKLGADSSILIPANAGGYASTAVRSNSLECEYYDVDLDGLPTIEMLSRAKSSTSRVLVVTHLYGQTPDMLAIMLWADNNNILVIEDCAQAAGASRNGKMAGGFGILSAFSFYPTKNLGATGDAGAICTNNESLASEIRALRQYGWKKKYVSETLGFNSRMDEIHAFVLSNELKKLDKYNFRRREIWQRYRSSLEKYGLQELLIGTFDSSFVAHLGVLRLKERKSFTDFFSDLKIGFDIHYPVPDYKHEAFRHSNVHKLNNTETLCESVTSIPLFESLSDFEVELVSEGLEQACERGLIS